MIARGSGGAIVNVSSQASMIALKDHTLYCKPINFFIFPKYIFFSILSISGFSFYFYCKPTLCNSMLQSLYW